MTGEGRDAAQDCAAGDAGLLLPEEASRRIAAGLVPVSGRERLALRQALGRYLATDIVSPLDVPGHVNSAVDGFALDGEALPRSAAKVFPVVGTAWAGRAWEGVAESGQAVRIMTGAVMPAGTDTVVMQEHVRPEAGGVRVEPGHRRGQNVRRAGEDIARGATVLRAGTGVLPADLGLLASLGIVEVEVHRRLTVAFFSTGDELRSLGEPLATGCVYDSNRYTLYAMLSRLGCEVRDMGVVRDDPQAVRTAFREAAAMADVVVTSGGVSVGEADYIHDTLAELGQVAFWKIAIKPGRPLAFGRLDGAHFFGLPGNPVAVMVTFYQFVRPALLRLMGDAGHRPQPTLRARALDAFAKRRGRVEYHRALLEHDARGEPAVRGAGPTGSGLLHTMSTANCFVVLPAERGPVAPGDPVEVQPFFGII